MTPNTPELQQVLERATAAGYDAEIYLRSGTATTIKVQDGDVDQFTLADSRGAGLRVIRDGRAGYAYTEDLSVEALTRTLEAAATNAILLPEGDTAALSTFEGDAPELGLYRPELADVPVPEKIRKAKEIERIAKAADPRIKNVTGSAYSDSHGMVRLMSTRGVDRTFRSSLAWTSTVPLLLAGDQHKNYYQVKAARAFDELDPERIAREAVERAAEKLGAREPQSGSYPVLFTPEAMADLLGVFAGIFSGKVAQEGKSLLKDRIGETIASSAVTLLDDPLNIAGFGARPFDDEGCPARSLELIADGVFQGFLHNSETARKAGTRSTGNAARGGYSGTLGVAPFNLYLAPGARTPEAILKGYARVAIVTEVTGLHAGANAISGDFSLQAQGFMAEGGDRRPIHNFTVSGNFYDLLKSVTEVASDLEWFTSSVGSPSVLVEELAIAGA